MRHRAFTLVEIMIVVLIIGVLLMIAMPGWMRARENSRQKTCVSNLRQISDAKEIWALDTKQQDGAPCATTDLWPNYINGGSFPSCPTNGTYTIGAVGETPTCTYTVGLFPHILTN